MFVAGLGYAAGTFHSQIAGSIGMMFGYRNYAGTLDLSSVQKTYQELVANYDGDLDAQKLIEGANKGLVDAVGDDYTVYMNAEESQAFDDDLAGNIGGGIGVELAERNDALMVVRVLKDNPAEKVGMAVGDILISVNDESVRDLRVDEAVLKIRGEAGTTVKLQVLRDNQTKQFTLTRAIINNPSVYTNISGSLGIMTVTRFDDQTGSLAKAAAEDFKARGVKKVILDLRGNGGGYITAAQDLAGLWLERQTVVSERSGGRVVEELKTGRNAILKDVPTIVLVNASSASASEIVAGALQDYGVAKLLGEQTFGKGSVQKLVSLPSGAELKVTVARWYTPKGKNISEEGVTPDTVVKMTQADYKAGKDPQLDAAKELLK